MDRAFAKASMPWSPSRLYERSMCDSFFKCAMGSMKTFIPIEPIMLYDRSRVVRLSKAPLESEPMNAIIPSEMSDGYGRSFNARWRSSGKSP
eukprot:scaffold190547_cov33-Tisochrysis_lutea.AAC.1